MAYQFDQPSTLSKRLTKESPESEWVKPESGSSQDIVEQQQKAEKEQVKRFKAGEQLPGIEEYRAAQRKRTKPAKTGDTKSVSDLYESPRATSPADTTPIAMKEYKPPVRDVPAAKAEPATAPAKTARTRKPVGGGLRGGFRLLGRGLKAVGRGVGKGIGGTAKGVGRTGKYIWEGKG